MDGYDEIGLRAIGEVRAIMLAGRSLLPDATGQKHLRSQCGKASFDSQCELKAQLRIVVLAGIEDDDLVRDTGAQVMHRGVIAQNSRIAAGDRSTQALECAEGIGTAGAIRVDTDPALELTQRVIGQRAEHAVGSTGVEAELIEPTLQFCHIITAHEMPGDELQDAIAELPASLVQAPERVRTDDAIGGQAAILLEGAHGKVQLLIE